MSRTCNLLTKPAGAFALLLPLAAAAGEAGFRLVPLRDAEFEKASYASIEDIQSGPWLSYEASAGPDRPGAERWRLLMIPPVGGGRPEALVEKVVRAADGCCQRVAGRWRIELPKENDQPFRFVGWTTPTSFIFELGGHQYTFSGLQAKDVPASPRAPVRDPNKPDPWERVRFLIGDWRGTASGRSGSGTVARSYAFILNDRFIQEENTSTYPPQEQNKKGEAHRHLSIISYDRKRKTLMLRQFHQESFVNLYALNAAATTPAKLVFEGEGFENFDNAWKARETYEIVSPDEFIETFELAPPGKPFEVYSRNHFRRAP